MMSPKWTPPAPQRSAWPELPVDDWTETLEALHLFTQIVGKIRLGCGPWINHSWGVPLYVQTEGLGTGLVPYGSRGFSLSFDLLTSQLRLTTTEGTVRTVPLQSISVAEFYDRVLDVMSDVDMPVNIYPIPSEIPDAQPMDQDTDVRPYDPDHARTLWRALLQAERVFTTFRAGFIGKVSPVHFFWGSFDLAVTRFSGRSAPPHPGGMPNFPDDVAREAYSHEVTSLGFWPGNRDSPTPIFYTYAYPTPDGFAQATVEPDAAFWLDDLGEFALPYEAVRTAKDPDDMLLSFAQSTHAAAADLAQWDRDPLEHPSPEPAHWWRRRGPGNQKM